MPNFTPQTEQEATASQKATGLWADGEYDFTIRKAEDRVSKAGNEFVNLQAELYNADGKSKFVFDTLMVTGDMSWKLRHACDAVGLTAEYESGSFDTLLFEERSGRLTLGTRKARTDRATGTEYPAQNVVMDYIPLAPGAAVPAARPAPPKPAAQAKSAIDSDDIPF